MQRPHCVVDSINFRSPFKLLPSIYELIFQFLDPRVVLEICKMIGEKLKCTVPSLASKQVNKRVSTEYFSGISYFWADLYG